MLSGKKCLFHQIYIICIYSNIHYDAALNKKICNLKGLSHEIHFKIFDKNLQNLALLRDAAGFWNFVGGSDDFKTQKVYLLQLLLICVGLTMVNCLFLSVLLITSGV